MASPVPMAARIKSILGRLLLGILLFAAPMHAHAQHATPDSAAARAAWGFDRSDLTPHPAMRFGVLPNGMRYALMGNGVPTGSLAVRLRIAAGSTVEGEREQGFMHLLEHMIFNGSKNLPQGALPLTLRRDGLMQWSDFNAFTSYDETVYRLDLSRSDHRARETALTVMREISSHLSFDRRAVEAAKQAVRAEIKERDAVQDRISAAQNRFFFPGAEIGRGSVASTEASVKRAKGAELQRLYALHYAPQRATLVMVGDFDPAAVEAEIAARFSDWPAGAAVEEKRLVPGVPPKRATEARLFVHPAAQTVVTIAVTEPLGGADAARRRDFQFLEHLGSEMLNRRLARIAAKPDAPFLSADSAIYDHFGAGRLTRMEVAAKDRDWQRALHGGAMELRRAVELGFSRAELDEQLAASRVGLASAAAAKRSSALADAIADAVGRGIVFTEPSDASAAQAYLNQVRLEDVNGAFKAAWAKASRLLFISHHRPIAGGEVAILAAWAELGS